MINQRIIFLALVLWLLTGTVSGQVQIEIRVQTQRSLRAGEAWQATITVSGVEVGEKITATLFNGLTRLDTVLVLGTGGIAVWQLPQDTLTQAGESLLVIQAGEVTARRFIRVFPDIAQRADLFASANNLQAYGDNNVMLVLLPQDRWGNAPMENSQFSGKALYPDGKTAQLRFWYRAGIGWSRLFSRGEPGRIRITLFSLDADDLLASLELHQTPGTPSQLHLMVTPGCVVSDGRDIVELSALVTDEAGLPVTDGTLVLFEWRGGQGYGLTIDGRAVLRLPSALTAGSYQYLASSGGVHSDPVILQVVAEGCQNDS